MTKPIDLVARSSRLPEADCDVSVIVANWNGEKLLGDCLASIYKETKGVSFEVIVSDDRSTDGSVFFVQKRFPDAKVRVNEINAGFARTNNAALPIVRGRYVLLLNNDTILENDALSAMVKFCDDRPGVGICGGYLLSRDGSHQHSFGAFPSIATEVGRALGIGRHGLFRKWPNLAQHARPNESSCEVGYIVGADLLIRADLARSLGLFDDGFEAYFEDADLCFRARRAGYKVVFLAAARIIHLIGQSYGNEMEAPSERKISLMETGFTRFCRKNYSPNYAAIVLGLRAWSFWLQIAWLSFRMRVEPARRHLRYRRNLQVYRLSYDKLRVVRQT